MTLSTQANRQDYTGNNCTKGFAYTFKITDTSDLDVFVDGCQKFLTTDYTVSGAGADTGGTVTFITTPGCDKAIAIVRDVPYTQATKYPENDPFPAASHEDALDKLTMLVQQIKEFATRSWRFAAGSAKAASGYVVDEPRGGFFPRVKGDCSGIEYVELKATGTYADPVTTKGDLIVGSALGAQERLGIISGFTLVANPDTGRPSWQPGLSVELTNKLDAALVAGDVVAIDKTCDRAVVAAGGSGCNRMFVVTAAAVGDDCLALFHLSGLIKNVKAEGCINRGFYVRKATTAQAVECSGTEMAVASPPAGSLGVAVTNAVGNLVDVIFWGKPDEGPGFPLIELSPISGTFASGEFPRLTKNLGVHAADYTLDFDNVGDECATWEKVVPAKVEFRTAIMHIHSRMEFACTGTVGWIVRHRSVLNAEAWDAAYTACNAMAAVGVKSTVGWVLDQCLTLTTTDWLAGRPLRVKILRDTAADTAAGKAKFVGAYIRFT
mgnify:CR=1 FL=1